ncbi:hypothetical protein CALVIDRAFT_567191 [Calocera viscosa TUFC12733]|uniref:Ubiquitin 3 binding protein But2 C-terminal domain-containing protein n=1 Tax=Calocera viscosa (strain TUFC12733) TaxID=1330018 RepID=A0A167IJK7_CALVF|nr:hypothetical protein CALVIDRAFT_567191 [Calocera viscosa TUFC12733]
MSSDKAEYMPLQPADTSSADSADEPSYTPPKHAIVLPPLLILAFLAALGTTMLNVSLLPFTLSALQSQKAPTYPEPMYEPEKYIGLENAPLLEGAPKDFGQLIPYQYRNGTFVDVNVVFPSVMAHINQTDPEVVYAEDTAGDSKKFVLSHENSMILQFTNFDDTKRDCAIVGFRPSDTDLTLPRPYKAEGEINVIEVWNLTRTGVLDAQTLSYDHRPPRTNYIGNIDFRKSPNSTTNRFPCPTGDGASVAVEFRCQRWECWVEMDMIRSDQDGARLGFELAQWNQEPEKP